MWKISEKLVLFLYFISTLDTAFCISCPSGWTAYDVSCYKYFSNLETWENARSNCIALGADLVVVKNLAESNFLYHTLISSDVWLGLRDITVEGEWVWIESGECSDYTNFNSGEPNNAGNEDCVELDYTNSDRWNDLQCSTTLGYVCEMFEDIEIPTTSTCPGDVVVIISIDDTSAPVTWTDPTYTDNECVVTVVQSHSSGYVITIPDGDISASISVTYTAYDRAGNPSVTCSFTATVSYCPIGWEYNSDFQSCYWVYTTTGSYASAATYCQGETGADLAVIASAEENAWIVTKLDTDSPGWTVAWIGYDDTTSEGQFEWAEGTAREGSVYENWNPGQPDDWGGEDCTEIFTSGVWNDQACTVTTHIAVCEKVIGCPDGWVFWLGHCYQFVSSSSSWSAAETGCSNLHSSGFLVSIASADENRVVGEEIGLVSNAWIGYTDSVSEGSFVWSSGKCSTYTNFNTNEPNNSGDEDCIEFETGTDNMWNDLSCSNTRSYVCEIFEADVENPTFANCPSDQNVNTESSENYATMSWIPPVDMDNQCVMSVVSNYVPGDLIHLSTGLPTTYSITYTATDGMGNTATCTFTVTVTDAESPTYDACPSSMTQNTDAGQSYTTATWVIPNFTDNSGEITVVASHTPSIQVELNAGATNIVTVTYDATDPQDNSAQCTFDITVSDIEIPVISGCPSDATFNTDAGQPYATSTWTEPTYSDNSGFSTPSSTQSPGYQLSLSAGLTASETITYTLMDPSSNSAVACTFIITVTDVEIPIISGCPSDTTFNTDAGQPYATSTWTEPTYSDNSGFSTPSSTQSSGYQLSLSAGLTASETITYNLMDPSSNSAVACTFIITITDVESPTYDACPSSMTPNTDAGQSYATATWTIPNFTDNSGETVNVVASHTPSIQVELNAGNTDTVTVTYVATDPSGNTFQCTFDITVSDAESPTYDVCPSSMTQNTDAGQSYATATWTIPNFTDNSGETVNVVASHTPSIQVELNDGDTDTVTVTYDATDPAGNTFQCTFDITVSDIEIPVISGCPSDATFNTDAGQPYATPTWTEPTYSDNSGFSTPSSTQSSGYQLSLSAGLTASETITYNLMDPSSNSAVACTFIITVTDDEDPVYDVCPGDQNLTMAYGMNYVNVTWTEPTYSDNSGFVDVTNTHDPDTAFYDNADVVYNGTDPTGNFLICTFYIEVTDRIPPEFTNCPGDMENNTLPGGKLQVLEWDDLIITDNADLNPVLTPLSTYSSGDAFFLGPGYDMSFKAVDESGNIGYCNFTILIIDAEPPQWSGCPGNITVVADEGLATADATWTEPTVEDNSDIVASQGQTHQPGDNFSFGDTIVTYTAADGSDNVGTCTFTVQVIDTEDPSYGNTCPSNIVIDTEPDEDYALVGWTEPTATDNVEVDTESGTHTPVEQITFDGAGVTTEVTYTAIDTSGNSVDCVFTITVEDNEVPYFAGCPGDTTLPTDPSSATGTSAWSPPSARDNVEVDHLLTTASHTPGSQFPIGDTTIRYEAFDTSANMGVCTFIVTIYDNQPPVISGCPSDQSVAADPGEAVSTFTWTPPSATDNVGVVSFTETNAPGSEFSIGETSVSYVATDAAGLSDTCSFNIEVIDNELPVITCPDDISETTDPGLPSTTITWPDVMATDNSGSATVSSFGHSYVSGDTFPIGPITLTYEATDSSTNSMSCSFDVDVIDDEDPVLSNQPSDISMSTDLGVATANVMWSAPTATDNSNEPVTVVSDIASGNTFNIGETEVTYTATDVNGNVLTHRFTVTITDDEPPTIINGPADVSSTTDTGEPDVTLTWVEPTASDNSGSAALSADYPPGSTFPIGSTTVVYTATDSFDNVATYSFLVVVEDDEDPMISCPILPATIQTETGESYASVMVPSATATDNSDSVSMTATGVQTQYEFQFPVVPYTISITATDPYDNFATCSFDITIIDEESPSITCPGDITTDTDSNEATAAVSWSVTTSDNSDMTVTLTEDGHSFSSGDPLPIGENALSYIASDVSGNTATCEFSITVNDNENPTISGCPSTVSVDTDFNSAMTVATWTEPTADDNSGSVTMTPDYASGDSFPVGSTTVTYTAIDPSSNTLECSFIVEVSDNYPPVFADVPDDITVTNDNGNAGADVTWAEPTVTDNSGTVESVEPSHASGSFFDIGDTVVTYVATDPSGNSDTITFTVTVQDIEAPVIDNCPSDITVSTSLNLNTGNVEWTEPTASDNSGLVTLSTTDSMGDFIIGTVPVSYVAVDEATTPNVATCTFDVTVEDDEPPVLANMPSDIVHFAELEETSSTITWDTPTASDNSGSTMVTSTHSPGDSFDVGETTVTYTVTDDSQNSIMESFTVTVHEHDTTPPEITNIPSDITADTDQGSDSTTVTWTEPSVTDNVGIIEVTSTHDSGDTFAIGTETVTYTATDLAGNVQTSSFTVTIEDNELPVLSDLPQDQNLDTGTGLSTATATWTEPSATDNSGDVDVTSDYSSGHAFDVGTTTVTYTATDGSGNEDTHTFTVTVTDNQLPMIVNCPGDITTTTDDDVSTANVEWTAPTATDNHGIDDLTVSTDSGSDFDVGETEVTYTAADLSGNEVTCSFTITVTDNQLPTFESCPTEPVTQTVPVGSGSVSVLLPDTMPVDNVAVTETTSTHQSGAEFNIGMTTVTVEAVDDAGNSGECSYIVEVEDTEDPVFIGCPLDIEQSTDAGSNDAVVDWTVPEATDNSGEPTVTFDQEPGDVFPIGISTVIYSAVDSDSNVATCSFTVRIQDEEAPVFTSTPQSQNQETTEGAATAVVTWSDPQATDNSGTDPTVTVDVPSGSTFPIGDTTVTVTAVDADGNEMTHSFVVSVSDNEDPVIDNMPDTVELTTDPGEATASHSWTDPTVTDNSGEVVTTPSHTSPSSFPIGTTEVSYEAEDPSGNVVTESFNVVVTDTEGPELVSTPSGAQGTTEPGSDSGMAFWTEPTFSDNTGDVTVTKSHEPGDSFPIGTTTVTYTAVDDAGNSLSTSFDVVIEDNEAPVFEDVPEDITVTLDTGETTASASWTAPLVSDNSGSSTLESSAEPGTVFPIGETVVTYTATDDAGNSDSVSFSVNIVDEESPQITCPDGLNIDTDAGSSTAVATWETPIATDNAGEPTVTSTLPSGSMFPLGVTPVLYTATDSSGNVATCAFYVQVQDSEAPTVDNLPGDIDAIAGEGESTATIEWEEPTASDNAGSVTVGRTHESPAVFPIGDTVVTYTFTDDSQNTLTHEFTVSVEDTQEPEFTSVPTTISASADPGSSETTVQWSTPTAEDNSGLVVVTSDPPSGSVFPIGTTEVVVTATDGDGNSVEESFEVTVTDDEVPVFNNVPSAIELEVSFGTSVEVTWTEPTATDNHELSSLVSDYEPGEEFSIGTTTVVYTATDASGNSAIFQFPVTILDASPPVLTGCPTLIDSCTDAGEFTSTTVVWTEPVAEDNVGIVSNTNNFQPGHTFVIGISEVFYTVTDAVGNTATCRFDVTVHDCESPTLSSLPSDITVDSNPGSSSVVVSWPAPTATDNSSPLTGIQPTVSPSIQPGSTFHIGNTDVVYTATDSFGNEVEGSFSVTVEDNEDPVIDGCPSNIQTGSSGVDWTTPSGVDNSGMVTITSTHSPGDAFDVGTTNVVYTVSDASGNTAQCQFTVTVIDTTAPIITCPDSQQVSTDFREPTAVVTWDDPEVIDQSTFSLTLTPSAVSGSTAFSVGAHIMTYVAVNSNGFDSDCTFTITVVDDEIPQLSCPDDITQPGGAVHWVVPTATDNTADVTLTSDHMPTDTFPIGVTSVEYTAEDQYANFAYCVFTITIEDDGSPVVETCPSIVQVEAVEGANTAVATWTTPTATDDQAVTSTVITHTPGDEFAIGVTTVMYTFGDASGNSATCSFSVIVSEPADTTVPLVTCPEDIIMTVSVGTTSTVVSWVVPQATDNVGIQSLTPTHFPSVSTFMLGETSVIYVAIDTSGNSAQCSFTVTVEVDNSAPTINGCPSDISKETSAGNIPLAISWVEPTATDNSGEAVSLTTTHDPGSAFNSGTTVVMYVAVDGSGNIATCTFDVVVAVEFVDIELPVITGCPADIGVTAPLGQTTTSVTWTAPTTTDNSGTPAFVTSHNPGNTFEGGTTIVTYTATDSSGNSAVCSFDVVVNIQTDSDAPTFTSFPDDIEKVVAPGTTDVIVTWNAPVATDDSGTAIVTSPYTPGQSFTEGTTTVVYTATDSSGNTAVSMFTVTVTVDSTPPTISNTPDDIVVVVEMGVTSTTVSWVEPTASDESGTVTQVGPNFSPGSVFPLGTTTVSYTYVDRYGNTATSQFDVTVQSEADTEPPFIYGCSGDISTTISGGADLVAVSWTQPTAMDNSGFFASANSHSPGDLFAEGTTEVVYEFEDAANNLARCTFDVIVTDLISLTCPVDETAIATTTSSPAQAYVEWIVPTIDESTGFVLSSTLPSGSFFSVGTTVVTYTARDSMGNTVTCSFSVMVTAQDTTPPVIVDLPSDITASMTAGRDTALVTWVSPTANDNSNSYSLVGNYDPPAEFEVGTTVVTYTATDAEGNVATASFAVTVVDNERPSISGCPSSQTFYVLDSSSTALVHWAEPTATDNAGDVSMVSNISPGDRLTPGQYIVTYTATDQSGNTATCSFTLTISLATSTNTVAATTTFNTISGIDGSFSDNVADVILPQLEDDIEDAIRQSELSSSIVGVTINDYSFDADNNPVVDYSILFRSGSTVTDADVEAILNAALNNGAFANGNTVQDGVFYIGIGQCAEVTCQNAGICSRVGDEYECVCTLSWSGAMCQTDVDECLSSSACSSDLICKNTFGSYSCECEPGFHLKGSVCVLSKEITGEFAIAEIAEDTAIFTSVYADNTSPEYLELESKVVEALTGVFQNLPGFVAVYVFEFSSGSIKVQYVVQFDYESNSTAPDVNTVFNENVASDGILSDSILDLEPESYQVIEEICPPDYCVNGATCLIDQNTYVSMCICTDGYEGDRCEVPVVEKVTGDEFKVVGIVLGSLAAFVFVFIILAGFCCWLVGARRRDRKGALYEDDDHRMIGTPTIVRASPALVPVFYPPPVADNGYDLREESSFRNLDEVSTRRSIRDGNGFLNPYVATGSRTGYINKAHSSMNQFDDDRYSVDENNLGLHDNHRMY